MWYNSAMENSGQLNQTPTPTPVTPAAPAPASSLRIVLLLEECVKRKASDLHLQYGLPPILRIDGALVPIAGLPALNSDMLANVIFATLDEEQKSIYLKDK